MKDKFIFDIIHGYIEIDPICLKIIDTPEFQRLRNLKQLGLSYLIFPSANHTRFEHSIGVSFLSGLILTHLKKTQPELGITEREIQLIKIAGLCHDLGHGPFSHFFDNYLVKDYSNHEDRSCMILDYIINKYKLNIDNQDKTIIFNMINPKENIKNKGFLYKIVNNKDNGIDVDKFDYVKRDSFYLGMSFGFDSSRIIKHVRIINNQICFLDKTFFDIQELFEVRDKLHQRVYQHHTNTILDYMMKDIFLDLNKNIDFKKICNNPKLFCRIDDNYIWNLENKILENIKNRKLYKFINDYTKEEFKKNIDSDLDSNGENIIFHNLEFGYQNEKFKNIFFYNKEKYNIKFLKEIRFNKTIKIIRVINKF
tara:strand:- start:1125 stop:2225 length:1101 start_codon:yes stop_codon:yes gene_type:complete